MTNDHLAYPTDLIEQTVRYLMARPYVEVNQLITGFQTLGVKVEVQQKEEAPDDQ